MKRHHRLHVYAAGHQPATRFVVVLNTSRGDVHHTFRRKPRSYVYAYCCRTRRWAANCTTQVYYDAQYFWCRPNKGCGGKRP